MSPCSPSSPSTAAAAKPASGYFQCGSCNKYYNRADHLIRHVRSHTREKPYACQICHKGFGRPDLMKRHAAGHDREDFREHRSSVGAKHARVSQACKACAASKLKCDEAKPCQRCREKRIVCDSAHNLAVTEMSSQLPQEQDLRNLQYEQPLVIPELLEVPAASPPIPLRMNDYPTPGQFQPSVNSADFVAENDLLTTPISAYDVVPGSTISPTDHGSGIFSIDGTFFPEFIPDSLPSSLMRANEADMGLSPPLDHSTFSAYNHFNFNMNFDLTDVDYGLIDLFNANGVSQGINYISNPAVSNPAQDADNGIALGVDAFHRSSLSAWKPDHRDHAFADQENLSVSRTIIDNKETDISHNSPILCERLSLSSRDLIFGMVLQTSRRENMIGMIKSFPNTELLDRLIQDYFKFQQQQVDSWIHCPTFQPNVECPEILAALASAGATLSPISTIRKLGYALMEIVRLRLITMYEADNSVTRELRLSQAYALFISVGLWSGNGRKMEIAESSAQNLVTMLRRAFRYRRSKYPPIVPTVMDAGPELDKKWRHWVEQESFKRLVYHVFLHDSQAAITLHINPLISYSDLELPLPEPRRLWEAKSATEWKEVYLSLRMTSTDRIPSLADMLQDMSQLRLFQASVDTHIAAFVLLHGITALIMEYHRVRYISKGQCQHWHALIIKSRHQELCTALQHFRAVYSALDDPPRPEIDLVYEATSIFLYTSLEELQLFAGKEDKNEARRMYHSALEWINSIDSRRAILHAGQAVRAAKTISGTLRGFLAFAVYHAGLAFWSYSVVSKANKSSSKAQVINTSNARPFRSPPGPAVFMDSEDALDMQKFISLEYGDPALHGFQGSTVFVEDACQTMHIIQAVLRKDVQNEALQPLVLSLCQLMRDLGNAASGLSPRLA